MVPALFEAPRRAVTEPGRSSVGASIFRLTSGGRNGCGSLVPAAKRVIREVVQDMMRELTEAHEAHLSRHARVHRVADAATPDAHFDADQRAPRQRGD